MSEVLVATVLEPTRRYRIGKEKFDRINALAKEADRDSPFIVQEEDCEGGLTYDDLDAEGKKAVDKAQADRQAVIDAAIESESEGE